MVYQGLAIPLLNKHGLIPSGNHRWNSGLKVTFLEYLEVFPMGVSQDLTGFFCYRGLIRVHKPEFFGCGM
jgi:hypothetical protein